LNIGMGTAAASLSEMVGKEVSLSVPIVQFVSKFIAAERIAPDRGQNLSGVRENFDGVFKGRAILLFSEPQSLELVRVLLRENGLYLENLSETEQEAITEIGNIILNACLSSVANILHIQIENNVPEFFNGPIDQVLDLNERVDEQPIVLFLKMYFAIEQLAIQGYVTFLLDPIYIVDLKKTIHAFLAV
jgi:chemotaxis protein CheC